MDALEFYQKEVSPSEYFYNCFRGRAVMVHDLFTTLVSSNIPSRIITEDTLLVDIGCGPGTSLLSFKRKFGFKKIIGVDGSVPMVDFVNDQHIGPGVQAHVCNLLSERVAADDASARLVTCIMVLPYLPDLSNVFSEVGRILEPGGYFVADIISFAGNSDDQNFVCEVTDNLNMYYYSQNYLTKLFDSHGLEIFAEETRPWLGSNLRSLKCMNSNLIFKKSKNRD